VFKKIESPFGRRMATVEELFSVWQDLLKYNLLDVLAMAELPVSLFKWIDVVKDMMKDVRIRVGDVVVSYADLIPDLDVVFDVVSTATIPKKIIENFLKLFGSERYEELSSRIGMLFKEFYMGGQVKLNYFGRYRAREWIVYGDFKSMYPTIMNDMALLNMLAAFATGNVVEHRGGDAVRILYSILWEIERAKSVGEVYAKIMPRYMGVVAVRVPKELLVKVRISVKKRSGEILLSKRGDRENERTVTALFRDSEVVMDLPEFVANAWLYKIQNRLREFRRLIRFIEDGCYVVEFRRVAELDVPEELKQKIADWFNGVELRDPVLVFYAMRKRAKEMVKRGEIHERLGKALDYAFKQLMNSMYGIFANEIWRFRNYLVAAAVTAWGRSWSMVVEELIKRFGGKPLYADTDSWIFDGRPEIIDLVNKEFYGCAMFEERYMMRMVGFWMSLL